MDGGMLLDWWIDVWLAINGWMIDEWMDGFMKAYHFLSILLTDSNKISLLLWNISELKWRSLNEKQ